MPGTRAALWATLIALALVAGIATLTTALGPAHAQPPSPVPPECSCSNGVNLGTRSDPVVIRHCQCGILSCAVVVSSGQLQCVR